MKITVRILAVMLTLVMIVSMNAYSDDTPQDTRRGTLSVTGTASEGYPPDTVEIVLAVESRDKAVSEATRRNREAAEKVVSRMKGLISADKGDTIKTTSYSVQPEYEYDGILKKNKFTGFRVINEIMIRTSDIKSAGALIDSAIGEGANRVSTIRFMVMDDRAYCDELLKKATGNATAEAEAVAQSLRTPLKGVKEVTATCGGRAPQPLYPYQMARGEMAAAEAVTPVEAGETTLNASVSVTFYIGNE